MSGAPIPSTILAQDVKFGAESFMIQALFVCSALGSRSRCYQQARVTKPVKILGNPYKNDASRESVYKSGNPTYPLIVRLCHLIRAGAKIHRELNVLTFGVNRLLKVFASILNAS